jgi:4-amino-4-deoxy-L-arabinose transferase-like glycosyltransferase
MVARRRQMMDRLTPRVAGKATQPESGFASGRPAWWPSLWPLLLPLPTLLLAAWAIVAWKFNGLYGQDPFAYYDYGVGPLRRTVLDGAPLPALFWPLGYPILITVASLVLGPVTAAAQVVNVMAGVAAVCLTYLLGRDLLQQAGAGPWLARRAGALGALLLGLTGRLVESSVLTMADAVALATALLSVWALVRWSVGEQENRLHDGWLALSATALAWSVVTRWGQAALALTWLAALLPALRARGWRALPWAMIPAAAVLGAQVWLILTVRPAADLGPLPFAGDLGLVHGDGSGWSLQHLFQNSFVNADGVQRYPWPNALFYATGPFQLQYLTPLFLPAALVGLATVAVRYRRALLLLLSWPALLLLDAGLDEQNPRFILAALPPIAILAGLGVAVIWDHLQPRWRPLAAATLASGLLVVALLGVRVLATLNAERNGDLQVSTWAAARLPARATTLSFGLTLTLQHVTKLQVLDLSVLSTADLQRLIAHQHPLYLLVQVGVMNGQFAARPPGRNYRFLRGNPGLTSLGELHGYSLSRVGASSVAPTSSTGASLHPSARGSAARLDRSAVRRRRLLAAPGSV